MVPATGKWIMKPVMMRKIMATALIQWVITNGSG